METTIINKNKEKPLTDEFSFKDVKGKEETPIINVTSSDRQESYKPVTYADKTFVALASALLFSGEFGARVEETLLQKANPWSASINFEKHQGSDNDSDFEQWETTNNDRLELLARRYELKKLPPEDKARLAILTERIRILLPRVTEQDFEALAEMAERVKGIEDRRISLFRRLDGFQS